MEYTHIVVTTTATDMQYIYRAHNGLRIGGRQQKVVVYGTEPNKSSSHVFIDAHAASVWLREVWAAEDLKAQGIEGPVKIDYRSDDPVGIVVPDGIGEEFMAGGPTKLRRM